jgi:hypothetical protein
VKCPRSSVGQVATEDLAGTYDFATRQLEVKGTSKDDPNGIISQEEYRLTLSEDGLSLSGKSLKDGSWSVSDAVGSTRS